MKLALLFAALITMAISTHATAAKLIQQTIVPVDEASLRATLQQRSTRGSAVICKVFPKPGSRFEQEQCLTRAEWAAQRVRTSMELRVNLGIR